MNELFLLYLWTRLDALHGLTVLVFIVLSVLAFIAAFTYGVTRGDREPWDGHQVKATRYIWLPLMIISLTISLLVPTKQDAAIIAGGWLVKQAVTSEVAEKTYQLIVGKLDEQIKEFKK